MTPDEQRLMAFVGLVMWTEGVIEQARRTSEAMEGQTKVMAARPPYEPEAHRRRVREMRRAKDVFQCERHFFVNAAYKLLEHRKWIAEFKYVDEAAFAELDSCAEHIDVLRDMNEHYVEYFRGKGKRPKDWTYTDENGTADASSTVGTRIGNRLDWVQLGAAAERLLEKLDAMEMPSTQPSAYRPDQKGR